MLKRTAYLLCSIVTALGIVGCLWGIHVQREVLAVGLGAMALLSFMALWLMALPAALGRG